MALTRVKHYNAGFGNMDKDEFTFMKYKHGRFSPVKSKER